jgi:hypothetical protein
VKEKSEFPFSCRFSPFHLTQILFWYGYSVADFT